MNYPDVDQSKNPEIADTFCDIINLENALLFAFCNCLSYL
jgi:hypothetical protein